MAAERPDAQPKAEAILACRNSLDRMTCRRLSVAIVQPRFTPHSTMSSVVEHVPAHISELLHWVLGAPWWLKIDVLQP
jgi:hypothetical protein